MRTLVSLRTPYDPQISPDNRVIAFTVSWGDTAENRNRSDIWVVSAEGGSKTARPFIEGPGRETTPRWSPRGAWLAFFAARSSGLRADGTRFDGDPPTNQVWIIPSGGGQPRRLTEAPEGVESYRWTPDGSAVIYLARAPLKGDERARRDSNRKRGFDGIVEGIPLRPLEFWSQPAEGDSPRKLFTGDAGIDSWDLSSDGGMIVYSTNGTGIEDDEPLFDLWIVPTREGARKPRRLTSRHGPETRPSFSPDGTQVAFQADLDTTVTFSQEEIFVVPAEGGSPRCLTESLDLPATGPLWSRQGDTIWCEAADGADNLVALLNPEGPAHHLLRRSEAGTSYATDHVESPDGTRTAWIGEGPSHWAEVWTTSGTDPEGGAVTAMNPSFRAEEMPPIESFEWKASDGIRITGLLVVPRNTTPGELLPTIVFPHGGPYNRATRRLRGLPTSLVLASNGYLVLEPNYRGSRGFGEAFGQAIRNDLGSRELDDILSGLDELIRQGRSDADRLGVTGGSYGGYLANLAIARTDRFKAAVVSYGIFNLITDFSHGLSPSYEREYLGAYYWENLDTYWKRSPIALVQNIRTPVLLLHGEEDDRTPIAHSWEMWTALRTLKRPVEFVHYPRERHGFSEPNHRVDAARRTLSWFDRYLRKIP